MHPIVDHDSVRHHKEHKQADNLDPTTPARHIRDFDLKFKSTSDAHFHMGLTDSGDPRGLCYLWISFSSTLGKKERDEGIDVLCNYMGYAPVDPRTRTFTFRG